MKTYDAIIKDTGEVVGSTTSRNPYTHAIAISENGDRWQVVAWHGSITEANNSAWLKKYRKLGYKVEVCMARVDAGIRR